MTAMLRIKLDEFESTEGILSKSHKRGIALRDNLEYDHIQNIGEMQDPVQKLEAKKAYGAYCIFGKPLAYTAGFVSGLFEKLKSSRGK